MEHPPPRLERADLVLLFCGSVPRLDDDALEVFVWELDAHLRASLPWSVPPPPIGDPLFAFLYAAVLEQLEDLTDTEVVSMETAVLEEQDRRAGVATRRALERLVWRWRRAGLSRAWDGCAGCGGAGCPSCGREPS